MFQIDALDDMTEYDPVFVHSRREAVALLIGFGVMFVWCLGVSYAMGYAGSAAENLHGESVQTVFGLPRWVFWGVAVPWCASNVITFWFCIWYLEDDPLSAYDVLDGADQFQTPSERSAVNSPQDVEARGGRS